MKNEIIGYGSSFYTPSKKTLDSFKQIDFLKDYIMLYTGREAIYYVILFISKIKKIETIWMPDYYCPFVKSWLEKRFDNIKYYTLDPFNKTAQPNWSQFKPDTDVVILNNYWGVRSYDLPSTKRPIVVEDHSHGWLSHNCINSKADFCVASLRKTVPLPLGGIAWIPKDNKTYSNFKSANIFTKVDTPYTKMSEAWDILQKAMNLKSACRNKTSKKAYLNHFAEGEGFIRENKDVYEVANSHKKELEKISFNNYNESKNRNLKWIILNITRNKNFKIINTDDQDYFGLILVFKTKEAQNNLKQYLITHNIYPAELWPENFLQNTYKYLLNIHVDFRYNRNDMKHIAEVINLWPNKVEV